MGPTQPGHEHHENGEAQGGKAEVHPALAALAHHVAHGQLHKAGGSSRASRGRAGSGNAARGLGGWGGHGARGAEMKVWHRRRRNPGPEERGQGLCGVVGLGGPGHCSHGLVVLDAGFGALEAVHWSKERRPGFPPAFQLTSAYSPLFQLRPRRRSMARWLWALLLGRPSLEHLLRARSPCLVLVAYGWT